MMAAAPAPAPRSRPALTNRANRKSPTAYRTISEVSDELDVPQHVLRFWESKFSQVRPLKRAGGRRYYRPEDIALLNRIRGFLYDEGYTIKGVQKLLKEGAGKPEAAASPAATADAAEAGQAASPLTRLDTVEAGPAGLSPQIRGELQTLLASLKTLRARLRGD